LRIERHVANARAIAAFLDGHPAVTWVSYPGLPSSPSHALAARYLPRGPGSVFTIGLRGGYESGVRAVESVNLWSHLANVGDTRSLILHPASTTHRQLSDEERLAAGAGPEVLRLSVGIESVDDLMADLDQAISRPADRR
jgi:O-acetylhomoserine (thiol)-lyase